MRKVLFAALCLFPLSAMATEVLVQTTSTRVDGAATTFRRGVELLNLGPNSIWCNVGTATVVTAKARRVTSGDAWFFPVRAGVPIYCLADTANQVTGAATVVTEAK
jgi:hypothetical protein